jgi:thiosulfate reductase cytochrome b subunit
MVSGAATNAGERLHRGWVRLAHWLFATAILTLMTSGLYILAAHPRLYWGEVGNDMTPALVEVPLGPNHHLPGWETQTFPLVPHAVSGARTVGIYNKNGWARSLHFLAAWLLVVSFGSYLLTAAIGGHLRRNLLPRKADFSPSRLRADLRSHLSWKALRASTLGPPYEPLQKLSYFSVIVVLLPLMVLTGLAMSPAIAAATGLPTLFGGSQSARTIHFACFALLLAFLLAHLVMILASGLWRQVRAMVVGR